MAETFDVFRYMGYLRFRWRWIATVCGLALAVTFVVSMILPREYTATARIVIEPPAGSDLRSAMAVSPIYLESLKTYESYASSDSLFLQALDQFNLRQSLGARPVESLKRRVLKVGIVRNTRILEISASLPDPKKAQALANFLAASTVNLARSTADEGSRDLVHGIEQEAAQGRARLQETEDAWSKLLTSEPIADLEAAMETAAELRGKMEEQIASAELEISENADRPEQATAARARLAGMRKQLEALDRRNAERERLLSVRRAHRDKLESERKARLAELAGVEAKLREARGDAPYRGERLKIIDPGIVPERPSSPNVPLNLAAALIASLAFAVLYLTFEMTSAERRAGAHRTVFRIHQAGDD